jgi:hypothetical protein
LQPNLPQLINQDTDLQAIFQFFQTGNWQPHLSKRQIRSLATLALEVFFDKNKLVWIRLDYYKYTRTFGYWNYTEKKLCVTLMIKFLQATTQLRKHT